MDHGISSPQGEGRTAAGFQITDECYPPYETTEHDEYMDDLHDERPAGCPNDGNSQFRITPDDDRLRPLLEGFAMATSQMRVLREAMIWSPLNWLTNEDPEIDYAKYGLWKDIQLMWGIHYWAPGREAGPGPTRRLEWRVASWRPDAELHDRFQQIGRAEHGEQLEEEWVQDEFEGQTFVFRYSMDYVFSGDLGRISV